MTRNYSPQDWARTSRTLITNAAMAIALAGCGGGGTAPLDAQGQPLGIDGLISTIEVYSDSTGVGVDGAGLIDYACPPAGCPFVAHPWPSLVQVPGYTVRNLSVGGLSALDLLQGHKDLGVQPWAQVMAASSARIIIIALCINDAGTSTPAQYRATLQTLIDMAHQRPGRTVLLQTPYSQGRPDVAALAQVMRVTWLNTPLPPQGSMGGRTLLLDQDTLIANAVRRGGIEPSTAVPDGIHPGQPVYSLMADNLNAYGIRLISLTESPAP